MRFSTWMWIINRFLALPLLLGCCGCALLMPSDPAPTNPLPDVVGPKDAIELEIYFVDRRVDDPLIGESLWGVLHPVGALDAQARKKLQQDGFRVAMSPARPPLELQSLMDVISQNDPTKRASLRRYTLPSGQETWVIASMLPDGTPVRLETTEGIRELSTLQGQCIFRVEANQVKDGWAKISVTPELRHGHHTLRPTATDEEWIYRQRQNSVIFYEDRLTAEVNVGEILVIGLAPHSDQKLASRFFRADPSQQIERLMLIRVNDMREVQPIRVSRE